jgi:hypothetical protein
MATQVKAVWKVACLTTFDHSFPRTEGQEVVRGGIRDEDLYEDEMARKDVAKPILSSGRTSCDTHSQCGPSMEKEDVLKLFAGRRDSIRRGKNGNRMPRPARPFGGMHSDSLHYTPY